MPWRCLDYIIQKGAEKIGVPYLPDRCAHGVVCVDTLGNVDDRARSLGELARILAPGARL